MRRVGVLTGIAVERRIVTAAAHGIVPEPLVFCAGAHAGRARAEAHRLLAAGAEALLSFGIAGGLDPDLPTGALILADCVLSPDGRRHNTDADWLHRVTEAAHAAGLRPVLRAMAGTDQVLKTTADKQAYAKWTGAAAVDMESHAIAELAARAAVPFLVVRAIADTATQALPHAAVDSISPTGRTHVARVAARMAARPRELPGLIRLGRSAAAAAATLRRLASAAGPDLFLAA